MNVTIGSSSRNVKAFKYLTSLLNNENCNYERLQFDLKVTCNYSIKTMELVN
jgi:hypothetical protein